MENNYFSNTAEEQQTSHQPTGRLTDQQTNKLVANAAVPEPEGSSLCSHSPVTSSLLGPYILLRTLFSNTISLCSSLIMRDQVSHPYKQLAELWFCIF
jgi:hypothetical protein